MGLKDAQGHIAGRLECWGWGARLRDGAPKGLSGRDAGRGGGAGPLIARQPEWPARQQRFPRSA